MLRVLETWRAIRSCSSLLIIWAQECGEEIRLFRGPTNRVYIAERETLCFVCERLWNKSQVLRWCCVVLSLLCKEWLIDWLGKGNWEIDRQELAMEILRAHLSKVRIPEPSNRIYKQECCISFCTPVRMNRRVLFYFILMSLWMLMVWLMIWCGFEFVLSSNSVLL